MNFHKSRNNQIPEIRSFSKKYSKILPHIDKYTRYKGSKDKKRYHTNSYDDLRKIVKNYNNFGTK